MRRAGALPRLLIAALAVPEGRCYRHCTGALTQRAVRSRLPGIWRVGVCPGGVVSVTSYAEWTVRDPTDRVRAVLRRWSRPPALVRSHDLRLATRHGPELGRTAERFLARQRPARGVRVVYWRVYPSRAKDGTERRLFACFRHGHPTPVFFRADPARPGWACPACAPAPRAGRR